MRRAGRKKKPLTIQPIKCVVMLSSDEENDCIAAEKKENKQLKCRQPFLAATRAAFSGQSGPYFAASF